MSPCFTVCSNIDVDQEAIQKLLEYWNVIASGRTTKTSRTVIHVVSEHHPQNETSPARAANKRVGDSLI